MGKKLNVMAVVLYMLVAHICGNFLEVHWIHVFNSFMLVCILHNLLDWKFDWVEESEEENNDQQIDNRSS